MDFTLRGSSERAAQPPPWGEQLLIPIFPSSTLPYWWLPWETRFKNIQICSDTFTHDFLVAWKHLFWGSCSTDPTLVTEYNSFCNTVLSISFILLLLNHYSWVLQIDTSAALENKEKIKPSTAPQRIYYAEPQHFLSPVWKLDVGPSLNFFNYQLNLHNLLIRKCHHLAFLSHFSGKNLRALCNQFSESSCEVSKYYPSLRDEKLIQREVKLSKVTQWQSQQQNL